MTTPTTTYNLPTPVERDDIELVQMFLAGFKDENGEMRVSQRTFAVRKECICADRN
jgi:hypothetical protein